MDSFILLNGYNYASHKTDLNKSAMTLYIYIAYLHMNIWYALANGSANENHSYNQVTESRQGGGDNRLRPELRIVIDSNLHSPIIDCLVLQTLAIIRTLVDK